MVKFDLKDEIKVEKEIAFYRARMIEYRNKMYQATQRLNKMRNPHLFFDEIKR